MLRAQSFTDRIRLTENNDWVIFILITCLFLYIFMMNVVEREANLRDFLLQKFYDASNNFPSWMITSTVTVLSLSVLMSQYIPVVPGFVGQYEIAGYGLNKIGYCLIVIVLFYLLRTALGFLLYQSIGDGRKWAIFYFTATKFHFVFTFLVLILCTVHYYFPIDRKVAFIYYLGFFATVFIFKIFFYLFHKNKVLPEKWYYKILYICTLQIAPLLLLWKLLFF